MRYRRPQNIATYSLPPKSEEKLRKNFGRGWASKKEQKKDQRPPLPPSKHKTKCLAGQEVKRTKYSQHNTVQYSCNDPAYNTIWLITKVRFL